MRRVLRSEMPQGFRYIPEFLSALEENILHKELEGQSWDETGLIRKRGQIVRRPELDFLHNFGRLTYKLTPGKPLLPILASLRRKIGRSLGVRPAVFQQVITTLYRPGAGIDWHIDAPLTFGDTICGVSIGSACTIQFRELESGELWSLRIAPRSMYVLQDHVRWICQHRIPPVGDTRYSITLRTLD